ncbi:hypothetical protein HG530_000497 [Fusarium avenaceum]|nr:hypothetical protein HG530_000497 [Fusarium avenaceum]
MGRRDLDVVVFVVDQRVKPLLNNLIHLDDLCDHTLGLNVAFRYGFDNLFEISKTLVTHHPINIDKHTSCLQAIKSCVDRMLRTSSIEAHISSQPTSQCLDMSNDIVFCRIKNMMSTEFLCKLASPCANFAQDDGLASPTDKRLNNSQTNGTTTNDESSVAFFVGR